MTHTSAHWRMYAGTGKGHGTQADDRFAVRINEGVGCVLFRAVNRRFMAIDVLRSAVRVSSRMGLHVTQDTLRQVCTWSLLREFAPSSVLLIGDGFGVLAGIIADTTREIQIDLVDIPETLSEQQHLLKKAFEESRFAFHLPQALPDARFDLAISVAAFQEMEPQEIARYFEYLKLNATRFYCCSREQKRLPDGTITSFRDYPWSGLIELNGPCPWHQRFFSARPPFVHRYDGTHLHRIIRFSN
jgi:hypothetical protein